MSKFSFNPFSCFSGCTSKPIKKEESIVFSPLTLGVKYSETIPFVPPVETGYIVKVYDGDTITLATRLPIVPLDKQPIYRFSVRLNGIDTPEIKGKDHDEKTAAVRARDFLSQHVMDKMVTLEDVKLEKYGRLLATVISDKGDNMNKLMVKKRHAVAYDGGTKKSPVSWQRYYDTGKIE